MTYNTGQQIRVSSKVIYVLVKILCLKHIAIEHFKKKEQRITWDKHCLLYINESA